jgi:hypothetical protein
MAKLPDASAMRATRGPMIPYTLPVYSAGTLPVTNAVMVPGRVTSVVTSVLAGGSHTGDQLPWS